MKFNIDDTTERRRATYNIYLNLHAARDLYHRKTLRTVMTEMMYAEPEAWKAVGITRAALAAYADAGHRKISGIERAHLTDRFKMIAHVFDTAHPMSQAELFDFWGETDRVVISLMSENRANMLGDWIPFSNPDAHYFQRLGIGFSYRPQIEGELTRQLSQNVSAL